MEARPSLLSRVVRAVLLALYRTRALSVSGQVPATRRCVIIGAPHTSNWDFLCFLGITETLGVRASFMGKASLFRWPMGRFMREMGGVPVDRSSSHNYVDAMVAEFARRDEFMLVIAPEGTRGGAHRWKTGFYHIALKAGVPIVCGFVDYERRRGGFGPAIMPSGDYASDMAKMAAFYATVQPWMPEKMLADLQVQA
ncbi:MAG: lysophospholipid acyltransferase family protein [Novosphingobium sp.]